MIEKTTWLLPGRPDASPLSKRPRRCHPSRVPCLPAHTSGDCFRLPWPDTEARHQKGEEGDATLDLVLKHPGATYD